MSEPAVTGEQGRLQRLGQCDVGGVVGGQVVPQLPTARQQRQMCGPVHRQRRQIRQGQRRSAVVEHPHPVLTTQHRGDLQVDQFWYCQRLTTKPGASGIPVGAVVGQGDREDAGVNDEHGPPARS